MSLENSWLTAAEQKGYDKNFTFSAPATDEKKTWGILQDIPYNRLTSKNNKNHHRSCTKLLAYWQELSNPTVCEVQSSAKLRSETILARVSLVLEPK